jgi:peptidoglycan hydrolase CwlO-like protein
VLLVLLVTAAVASASVAGAGAQTSPTEPSVEALRAQADAIATRYFEVLNRSHELDAEVTRTRQTVTELEARAERARNAARARALIAYRQSGSRLSAVIDSTNALDAARRARLIDRVNERDRNTFDHLRGVTKELEARRRDLEATQAEQAATLDDLREQGAAVDAKLAEAARREAAERAAAAAAAAIAAQAATPPSSSTPTTAPGSAGAAPSTTGPTTGAPPTTTTPPAATPEPPPYSGTPGTHPRHDDPFLTCVRARESSGNYGAVNPAGPYLGAYQFLQSTWNAAANHARRPELVGVPANLASAYDQDDVAWALYQWQGSGPWGGACG